MQMVRLSTIIDASYSFSASGKVKPVVDSVFAFEDVLKGYERVLSGRAVGKIIVKVDPSVE